MRLELTVDELELDGFDPRDRHRIADAIERELAERTDLLDCSCSGPGQQTGDRNAIEVAVASAVREAMLRTKVHAPTHRERIRP
jgi:hypothetical protein